MKKELAIIEGKEYDGKEILDFRHEGYDFPNIIKVKSDNYMLLDDEGNVVGEDIDIDLKNDQIQFIGAVRSEYFPKDKVLSTIMELCGDGKGLTNKYGAFFYRNDTHCFPKNISFLSSFTTQSLQGNNWARTRVDDGVNYEVNYAVIFDEPIVRTGATALSTSAWLKSVELHIWMPDIFRNQAFLNSCVHDLMNKGCTIYHNKKTDYVLLSSNRDQLFVVYHNWNNREYEFRILITPNTEDNRNNWSSFVDNLK